MLQVSQCQCCCSDREGMKMMVMEFVNELVESRKRVFLVVFSGYKSHTTLISEDRVSF